MPFDIVSSVVFAFLVYMAAKYLLKLYERLKSNKKEKGDENEKEKEM